MLVSGFTNKIREELRLISVCLGNMQTKVMIPLNKAFLLYNMAIATTNKKCKKADNVISQ